MKIHKPVWRDATNDYPEIKQAFFVAQQVSQTGEQVLTDMINKLWDMEVESDEEQFKSWANVVDLIGLNETVKRLASHNKVIPDDFLAYYKFMK